MRLIIDPRPSIDLFNSEMQLVVELADEALPCVNVPRGESTPDRHFLLGLAQRLSVAIDEKDPDCVCFLEVASVVFETERESRVLDAPLLMVKTEDGSQGALIVGDPLEGRRLAKRSVRQFTSAIRLDIP